MVCSLQVGINHFLLKDYVINANKITICANFYNGLHKKSTPGMYKSFLCFKKSTPGEYSYNLLFFFTTVCTNSGFISKSLLQVRTNSFCFKKLRSE